MLGAGGHASPLWLVGYRSVVAYIQGDSGKLASASEAPQSIGPWWSYPDRALLGACRFLFGAGCTSRSASYHSPLLALRKRLVSFTAHATVSRQSLLP